MSILRSYLTWDYYDGDNLTVFEKYVIFLPVMNTPVVLKPVTILTKKLRLTCSFNICHFLNFVCTLYCVSLTCILY